jgi:hypothetical protein
MEVERFKHRQGGSGLLRGRRSFFSSHHCGGFIFLPG